MAKALMGYLPGSDPLARLSAENAALRTRVGALLAEVGELTEALAAANAVADGRLADLVESAQHEVVDTDGAYASSLS